MSDSGTEPAAEVLNIGPRGVRQRGGVGAISLLAGVALGVWCVLASGAWPWRTAAVALVSFGALALLQARART